MIRRRQRKAGGPAGATGELIAQNLASLTAAGFLMSASHGELLEEDLPAVAAVVAGALGEQADEEQVMDIIEACDNALDNDGWEACVEAMASHLEAPEARRLALFVAAAALLADEELAAGETSDGFFQLAAALGCSGDEATRALEEARSSFE